MDNAGSRWSSSFYRARPSPDEAAGLLRASPENVSHWQDYFDVVGRDADLALLRESLTRVVAWRETQRIDVALAALGALGFSRLTPLSRLHILFEQVAKPWLDWAFDCGHYDLGLHLEGRIYNDYIKADETESHARRTYERLLPSITRAAKSLRCGTDRAGRDEVEPLPPKIAYFLHAPSTLAHAETLLNVLAALRRSPDPRFEPIVCIFQGSERAFDDRIAALGVQVIRLDQCDGGHSPHGIVARFNILRAYLQRERVHTLVWMSAMPWLAFAATMGLGVKLAWYSLKYHVLRLPEISGYLTNGDGGTRQIQGHPWQTIRLSGRWFEPRLTEKAKELRATLGAHRLTIGTLGREEKMVHPEFVESIARLLREHHDVLYLWSGRARPDGVLRIFERWGVSDRQKFLGWVDTKMASQMIDVYLDSFPAPSGFTAREAMAAGAAVVFYRSPEAEETGPNGFIRRLLDGDGSAEDVSSARAIMQPGDESLFLLAATPAEYVGHARRLLLDDAFRARAGAANKAWIATFHEDEAGMLESHARAVMAV